VARGDLADVSTLLPAASAAVAVIHCAAGDGPDFDALDAAAVPAMLDVLGPGRAFVRHGGTLVWGDTGARRFGGAEPAAPPLFLRARAALDDALIRRAGDRRVTVVCAPLVYGGTGGAIPKALALLARALGAAAYPGDGAQIWSTVHVEDWARLIADAAERAPAGGARHAAAHGETTLRDAAAAIGAALGLPGPRQAAPDELEAFGPLGLALSLSQRFSGARAAAALGWTPVHSAEAPRLSEGLAPPAPG
jgi:nucleoside-diphosphate-sugar epimerase